MASLAAPPPIESQLKVGPQLAAVLKPTYDKIVSGDPAKAYTAGASLVDKVAGPPPLSDPKNATGPAWIKPFTLSPALTPSTNVGGSAVVSGATGKGVPGIAKNALRYLGVPYVWGGETPSGFDCSGLLQYAAAQAGIHIARTTYDQWKEGRSVGLSQLKAGDAVFFTGSDSVNGLPGHVGIYIGGGKFIEAAHSGSPVRISSLAGYPGYMGARRYGRG